MHFYGFIFFKSFFLSSKGLKKTNQTDICEERFHWHREAKCELTTARFNRSLSCSEALLNPLCKPKIPTVMFHHHG